jgi:carbonic anhydrase
MKAKIVIFSLFFSLFAMAQEKKKVWDYPVKPGTKEWATFETGEQMFNACQIPLDILNTISTKELVTICLNYPLFNDYVAFNNEREGITLSLKIMIILILTH